jgi:hypothetical protein
VSGSHDLVGGVSRPFVSEKATGGVRAVATPLAAAFLMLATRSTSVASGASPLGVTAAKYKIYVTQTIRRLVMLGAVLATGASLVGIALHASVASARAAAVVTWIKSSNSLASSVQIANLDGSDVRTLGPGTSATVAPDGASVAVVQSLPPANNATSELLVYPASGGAAAVKLYHCDGFLAVDGWSADSKLILASCPHGLDDKGPLLVIAAGGGSVATIASGVIDGASFAPNSSDHVVYALGSSQLLAAPVNLFTTSPSGAGTQQLTHGWVITAPVWGPNSIVFARTTSRGKAIAPINQLWSIEPNGTALRQLTHMKVGPLASGLEPLAFSANGRHLLCGFSGTDQSSSWAVTLGGRTVVPRQLLNEFSVPDGISRDGSEVLLTKGFEGEPPSIVSAPWGGGKATVLVPHGANASWDE